MITRFTLNLNTERRTKPLSLQQVIKMAYSIKVLEESENGLRTYGVERQKTIEKAMISARNWLAMGFIVQISELEPDNYDL